MVESADRKKNERDLVGKMVVGENVEKGKEGKDEKEEKTAARWKLRGDEMRCAVRDGKNERIFFW